MRDNGYRLDAGTRSGWRQWVSSCLLLCLLSLPAGAQIRSYTFRPVGAEAGLSQGSAQAMVQDDLGFLWVATRNGLNRYDGSRFRVFRHDSRQENPLPENHITALSLDGRLLWMGFRSQYVASIDTRSGVIRHYAPHGPTQPLSPVRALLARNGRVWIASEGGVDVLDAASGRIRSVLPRNADADAPLQALLQDASGRMLLARGTALLRIDGNAAQAIAEAAAPLSSLLQARDGTIWAAGKDGLFRLRGDTLEKSWPLPIHHPAAEWPDARAIAQAPDGALWLALGKGGLVRYLPGNGKASRIQHRIGVPGTLQENELLSLLVDRTGTLWAGGAHLGPMRSNSLGDRFPYLYRLETPHDDPLTRSISIRGMAQDAQGEVWIGTDDGRLVRMSLSTPPAFHEFSASLQQAFAGAEGRPSIRVTRLLRKSVDEFWLATNLGLGVLETRSGRVERVPMPHDYLIRDIAPDAQGRLYLATHTGGLIRYDPQTRHYDHFALPGDRKTVEQVVYAVHVDRQGQVWAGGNGGLLRLDPASGRMRRWYMRRDRRDSLSSNIIFDINQDSAGRLWIGTLNGLDLLQAAADGEVHFSQPLNALLGQTEAPTIYSMIEGPPGQLWLGTDNGLFSYRPDSGQLRHYLIEQGLQDREFNSNATLKLRDGRLMIGGVRGANLFDPARMQRPVPHVPVQMTAFRIDDGAWSDWPDDLGKAGLRLAAGLPLRVRVQRMDFGSSLQPLYRYRLLPRDRQWIDNGSLNEFAFMQLPAGQHQLEVQATDRQGNWAPEMLKVPVFVPTSAWRSWPMLLLYLLLGGVLATLILHAAWRRRRRLQRETQAAQERETRLNLALWGAGESFWDFDVARRLLTVSYNPSEDSIERITHAVEIHPDDLPMVLARMRRYLRQPGTPGMLTSQHRVRYAGLDWHWVSTRGRAVKWDESGKVLAVSGTARDFTERLAAEHAQRIALEVLQNMAEAVTVLDEGFRIASINEAFSAMTGHPRETLIGQHADLLSGGAQARTAAQAMRRQLIEQGQWTGELWHRHRDGHDLLCHVQATVVTQHGHAHEGNGVHYVMVLGDVTERRKAEQELRQLANYDPLTRLPNRSLFNRRLAEAISSHRDGRQFAVMFLDLDRFKDINDSLGHAIGDQVLQATAERLQAMVAGEQLVSRLGGDEFTVIVERIASPHDAYLIARDILTAFASPLVLDNGLEFVITPSIGISLYPDDGRDAETLVRQADTAMYQAKASGRQMFRRYHSDMDAQSLQRLKISTLLRGALERDETQLVYQPRWNLHTGRVIGVEALLRWRHPDLGDVPPDIFIPLAEDTGLINVLGNWVANRACQTLSEWDAAGLRPLDMSINVSSVQLLREDFSGYIARCADVRGIRLNRLELEVTESLLIDNPKLAIERLQRLRAIGIQLSIDDFGTGYSSLSYLRGLPLNTLKIDRAFVADLAHDPRDEAIVVAIISMARSMGMRVVAEGVETEAQLAQLRRHGCDEAQGFLLAKPMDADACLAFLEAHGDRLDPRPAP